MLFILQKSLKSLKNHLTEFLDSLAPGELFQSPQPGAVTHARAKLKDSAFVELNRDCVLPAAYDSERAVQRWRGHRLLGVDSSLLRLPNEKELGEVFGWQECANQSGATGTAYPEARLSVLYDLLNGLGLDTRLQSSRVGEVALAIEQLDQLRPGDVEINDRGFSGYLYFAWVLYHRGHFIGRCSSASFLTAQEMFRRNRANASQIVWLYAPPAHKAECQRLGLPLKIKVRFISLRLPTGQLEVLATSLLDEALYPTEEFLTVYHWRWGHETFYLMLKGRLDTEHFSGRTVEAIRQDVQAAVLLANLERLLSEPTQQQLDQQAAGEQAQALQVNRSVSYHALKWKVLDLLYRDIPAEQVLVQLSSLLRASPVARRPERKPPERRKPSLARSLHFQRRVKTVVF
jgi:Transposase DDE domain